MELEMIYDKIDILTYLLAGGFLVAVVVAVVSASIRLGWVMMPWVLAIAAVVYFIT